MSVVEESVWYHIATQLQRTKGDKITKFAQVGDYCPNEACPDYGEGQGKKQRTIIKFGKTKAGRQRYRCNTCRATFMEIKGTIFYRRRTEEDEIIDTLAHIAEGDRISSLARIKGLSWPKTLIRQPYRQSGRDSSLGLLT